MGRHCKNAELSYIKCKLKEILEELKKEEAICNSYCSSIDQKAMDAAGGNFVITVSGEYCLVENVKGSISIDVSSVTLNLKAHILNADGKPYAITVNSANKVDVLNGKITGSTVSAVFVQGGSESVKLTTLGFNGNLLNDIEIKDSNSVEISKSVFYGDLGERAILANSSDNIVVDHITVTDFVSTLGALLEFHDCSDLVVGSVEMEKNKKAVAAPNDMYSASARFISFDNCHSVELFRIKVNKNDVASSVVGGSDFQAIGVSNSDSFNIRWSMIDSNHDLVGGLNAHNFGLFVGKTSGFTMNSSKIGFNTSDFPVALQSAIAVYETDDLRLNMTSVDHNGGNGLYLNDVKTSLVLSTQFLNNGSNGIFVEGGEDIVFKEVDAEKNVNTGFLFSGILTDIIFSACKAVHNTDGFVFDAKSKVTKSFVKNSKAINNSRFGFAHLSPQLLNIAFTQNLGEFNGSKDYTITNGFINIQSISVSTGAMANVALPPGVAVPTMPLGSYFTNIQYLV
jgi:hypothetical protein